MNSLSGVTALIAAPICAILFAGSAPAAPTNVLGVYEESTSTQCANITTCRVYFSTVPAPLKVVKVSCNFYFSSVTYNDVFVTGINLGNASSNKAKFTEARYLAPVSTLIVTATNNQYQLLADTLHVVPANYRPSVEVNFNKTTNMGLYCSISGTKT